MDIVTTDAFVRTPDKPDRRWYDGQDWPAGDQRVAIIERNFVFGSAVIRRATFDRVGGFTLGLPHDGEYEAWVRIIGAGGRAALVPEPLYVYHVGGSGLSGNRSGTYQTILAVLDRAEGRYGDDVDDAIRSRRRQVTVQLARAEGVEAVRRGDRLACLRLAALSPLDLGMRLRLGAAAAAPRLAARRL